MYPYGSFIFIRMEFFSYLEISGSMKISKYDDQKTIPLNEMEMLLKEAFNEGYTQGLERGLELGFENAATNSEKRNDLLVC